MTQENVGDENQSMLWVEYDLINFWPTLADLGAQHRPIWMRPLCEPINRMCLFQANQLLYLIKNAIFLDNLSTGKTQTTLVKAKEQTNKTIVTV